MPKIDLDAVPVQSGSSYPAPHAARVSGRHVQRLGKAAGLTQFGANLVTLDPGAWASQRHWHQEQDEFLMVTAGVLTLVDDQGETEMRAGDCAAFPAGEANGHHMRNLSDAPGSFLVIGTHTETETGHYPDIDMMVRQAGGSSAFTRRDGSPVDPDDETV